MQRAASTWAVLIVAWADVAEMNATDAMADTTAKCSLREFKKNLLIDYAYGA